MGNCCRSPAATVSSPPPPSRLLPVSSPFFPSPAAATLDSLYILGEELGRGQSGVIRTCTSRATGLLLACKSIPKTTAASAEQAAREAQIMALLSSSTPEPSPLLRLHHAFEDPDHIHLILDLCRGGDLFDCLTQQRRFPEPCVATILSTLLRSLLFCHSRGIMHRDLKPENILLLHPHSDYSMIKLADFGLAVRFTPGERFDEVVGSSYYMAPEMLRGDEYDEAVDVWSAGVIAYVLLSGWPPFGGHTEQAIRNAIQKGKLTFRPPNIWSLISPYAIDLVSSMLCLDPSTRCTLTKALDHPWILQHCGNKESKNIE